MTENLEVAFTSLNDHKSYYTYTIIEIPRIGEYVTIYDTPKSGKVLLEGEVVEVRWVIVDSEKSLGVTVVLDGVTLGKH